MRLIAKFYVQSFHQWPSGGDDAGSLHLGAVCRGEENASWSAATPAGSLEIPADHPDGAAALAAFRTEEGAPECHVFVELDPAGEWELKACRFAWKGVEVELERTKRPSGDHRAGKLTMTINNGDAAKALRKAHADALVADVPARCRVWTGPLDA